MKVIDKNNEEIDVSFIKPSDFLGYLLRKHPELLLGGIRSVEAGQEHLHSFWSHYETMHPKHQMFVENNASRTTRNTLCVCLHGDEGRGLKKTNTVIMMMESCLGLNTYENVTNKRSYSHCTSCSLRDPYAKRFKLNSGMMQESSFSSDEPLCVYQAHNGKFHSFLTKFTLAVLPNKVYKDSDAFKQVVLAISLDMKQLFEEGIFVENRRWFAALCGQKGDLKYFEKLFGLTRCFNKQIGAGLQMCHECEAGCVNLPFEDAGHVPCWSGHLFKTRPWVSTPDICRIPFDDQEPERVMRRDWFHQTKVGLFRDFIGSTILLLIHLSYFHEAGESNARDVCLERAFHHFYLYCKTISKVAGLRSFTPMFFNAAKKKKKTVWLGVLQRI